MNCNLCISYDSTFDGFLSAIFEIYSQHLDVGDFLPDREGSRPMDMFLQPFRVETREESANRVRRSIVNRASGEVLGLLEAALLSEEPGTEMKIFAYLRKLFSGEDPDFGKNPASMELLPLYKLAQSVRREAGNMLGMVRFSKGPDDFYIAQIEPKYDILMLMEAHFRRRFATAKWIIYDAKRKYGLFHEKNGISQVVTLPNPEVLTQKLSPDSWTELWKVFYDSIAIKERENAKLLRQCLPERYWKYLPERNRALLW